MFNFIDALMEYQKDAESPDNFWRWAAISCLSATLRNNVYLETRIGKILPNMYIVLYADSGAARKGAPVKFAGKLLNATQCTKVVAGRTSMQAAVKELGGTYTNDRGKIIQGSAGLLYSEELAALMVQDPATIDLLIDLYDYHENWTNNLVNSGKTKLKEVCLSLLAASNSDLFTKSYAAQGIKNGLLGRTMIIKEEKARKRMSLLDLPPVNESKILELVNHIEKISLIKGVLKLSSEAHKFYNDWYYGAPQELLTDKIGYASRLGTHVFKVAIALAAAREDFHEMLINRTDVENAVNLCIEVKRNLRAVTIGTGSNTGAYQCGLIVKAVIAEPSHRITRKKLVQRLLGEIDVEGLDAALLLLQQGGLMEEGIMNGEITIGITQKGIQVLVIGDES